MRRRTSLGREPPSRATPPSVDPRAAVAYKFASQAKISRVVSIVWAISAAVATCAGVLLAPITFIHSNVGLVLGLKAFPAAVLGGFGSIPGAVVGGVLIGVIESMAGFYLAQGWKDVAHYIVLLVVLLLKPEGLFGLRMRKKV